VADIAEPSGFATAAEFEAWYAENSMVPVWELHFLGLHAGPCDCGEPDCLGWQMTRPWEDAIVEDEIRTARDG
jgi:hypothetical protein